MDNDFFKRPILNSPYEYPSRHWELDSTGQPTGERKGQTSQRELALDEGRGLSTEKQKYDLTSAVINEIRHYVGQWRNLPNPNDWKVTPETQRLLQHWRHHRFNLFRPFFCQVEAVETAIWLSSDYRESWIPARNLPTQGNSFSCLAGFLADRVRVQS